MKIQSFAQLRQAAQKGIVDLYIACPITADGGSTVVINNGNLRFKPGVAPIDLNNQPQALDIRTCPVDTYGRQLFKNARPAPITEDTDDSASVVGWFGGHPVNAEWFGLGHERKQDPWPFVQAAIDAGPVIELPGFTNTPSSSTNYTESLPFGKPLRLDRGAKRLIGKGPAFNKFWFSRVDYGSDVHLQGAINLSTVNTIASSRFLTGIEGIEIYYRDNAAKSTIFAGGTLEEGTYIDNVWLDGFPQYGIRISGGQNGLHISNIHAIQAGHYSGGEKGFFLKDGPESNPRGGLTLSRITYNSSGSADVFGYCFRNNGRVYMTQLHTEGPTKAYWFDQAADVETGGANLIAFMGECDHRPYNDSDTTILINESGGVPDSRLKLECRHINMLHDGATPATPIMVKDDVHAVNALGYPGATLQSYKRNNSAFDAPVIVGF